LQQKKQSRGDDIATVPSQYMLARLLPNFSFQCCIFFAVDQDLFGVGTRGDQGGASFADLGSAGGVMVDAALDNTYFPPSNRTATELADVYPVHGVIPKSVWIQLSGWLEFLRDVGKEKPRYSSFLSIFFSCRT